MKDLADPDCKTPNYDIVNMACPKGGIVVGEQIKVTVTISNNSTFDPGVNLTVSGKIGNKVIFTNSKDVNAKFDNNSTYEFTYIPDKASANIVWTAKLSGEYMDEGKNNDSCKTNLNK
jgi:hypothetical protein